VKRLLAFELVRLRVVMESPQEAQRGLAAYSPTRRGNAQSNYEFRSQRIGLAINECRFKNAEGNSLLMPRMALKLGLVLGKHADPDNARPAES
jgi:hypothetical protein